MKRIVGTILLALGLCAGPIACKKQERSVTTTGSETTTSSADTSLKATPPAYDSPADRPKDLALGRDLMPGPETSRDVIARTGSGIPGNTGIGSSGGGALGNTVGRPLPVDPSAERIQPTERIGNTGTGSAGGGALGNTVGNDKLAAGDRAAARPSKGETLALRPGNSGKIDTALIGTWRDRNDDEDSEATYILKEDGSFHLDLVTKNDDDTGCNSLATIDGMARTVGGQAVLDVKRSAVELRDCNDKKMNRGPVALTSTEVEKITKLWPASYSVQGSLVVMTWKDGTKSKLKRADTEGDSARH